MLFGEGTFWRKHFFTEHFFGGSTFLVKELFGRGVFSADPFFGGRTFVVDLLVLKAKSNIWRRHFLVKMIFWYDIHVYPNTVECYYFYLTYTCMQLVQFTDRPMSSESGGRL